MKKLLSLATAMLAVLSVSAQDNLALNKTAIATSPAAGNVASYAVDGNQGTRWESAASDPQTWQVDLGSSQDFNTFTITWEGAYASDFAIYASDEVGTDGYVALDDANKVYSITGQSLSGFPNTQTYTLDKAAKARYVRFEGTKRGTPYGYSFWEFGIYNLTEALKTTSVTLTSNIANNSLAKGSTGQFSVTAKNQIGGIQTPTSVTYTSSNTQVGTIDANGLFTAVNAGTTTVTATADGVTSNEVTVTVIAGSKINLFTNNQYRIYTIGNTDGGSKVGAFDDSDASLWSLLGSTQTAGDEASRTYDVGFIADLGGVYDLSSASLHFEGACSKAYTLEFAGNDGVFGNTVNGGTGADAVDNHTETPDVSAAKGVRFVKFLSTKAATVYGVKLYDFTLYGTKTADVTDTEAPQITSVEAGNVTESSVTLNITGTDNASKYLTYEISADGMATVTSSSTDNESGKASSVVLKDLASGKTYNFTITAIDANGNRSEAKTATATTTGNSFTLTSAPTPTVEQANVASIYSDAYTPATTFTIGVWGQATAVNYEKVGDDNLMHLTNFNFVGLEFANPKDLNLSKYNYVHFDILPMTDMNSIKFSPVMHKDDNSASTEKLIETTGLKTKEWNSVDIALSDFGFDLANNTAFQLKFDGGNNGNFYLDNVYFYYGDKEEPVAPFSITTNASVAKVSGSVTAEDVEQINNADAMAIDLTGVTSIADGIKITPKHTNALIFVSGTVNNNVAPGIVDEKFNGLAETTNNLVVKQTYNFPVKQLQFIDKAGEPQWWGENAQNDGTRFISAGSVGCKVTTTIPAKSYITLYPTAAIAKADIPAGVNAWEAVNYENNTLSFNKVGGGLAAFFPYVLYNSNDEDVQIVQNFVNSGDFALIGWSTGNVAPRPVGASGVNFQGNFENAKVTDGSQWILKNNEDGTASIVKANGPKISAFRAYFTGLDATTTSAKVSFNDGETTGINSIISADANADNAQMYNLAGQKVSKSYKGIVIVNGKKFINK